MKEQPDFTIFVDMLCPVCAKEANLMRWLDGGRGGLALIDISSSAFDPSRYGRTQQQFMDEIHGMKSDGAIVTGMEVFRRSYAAVGWGWVLAPTAWPLLRPLADAGYRWFARNRLRLTGRVCDETCHG